MKTIVETKQFKLIETGRDYDFIYIITNETKNHSISIYFNNLDDTIIVEDYVGLFNNQLCFVEEILKGNYTIYKY